MGGAHTDARSAKRLALLIAAAYGLGACSLLTDLSGLSSGAPEQAAMAGEASVPDVSLRDGGADSDAGMEASTCPPLVADPSLVAWYPFEEGEGSRVEDCSGGGRHGTLSSGAAGASRVAGPRGGGALALSGNGACFDLGVAPTLAFERRPFTVAAWIRPSTFGVPSGSADPAPRIIFSVYRRSSASGWSLGTDDVRSVELKLYPGGPFVESQMDVTTGAWTHVAATFSGGASPVMQLYENGALARTSTTTEAPALDPNAHGFIGCRDGDAYFDGALDDLRIYSRVLPVAELTSLARP